MKLSLAYILAAAMRAATLQDGELKGEPMAYYLTIVRTEGQSPQCGGVVKVGS